jgi:hypothetical protein
MNVDQSQVRADALSVLGDTLDWVLTPARWAEVEGILAGLGAAPDLADPDQLAALARATSLLEFAGPVRNTRITADATRIPGQLEDRVNQLIHGLESPRQAGQAEDQEGTSEARSGQ